MTNEEELKRLNSQLFDDLIRLRKNHAEELHELLDQMEMMKCCENCRHSYGKEHCRGCDRDYSGWELKER